MADKSKQSLANMLGGEAKKPEIRRGRGVRLSTEVEAPTNEETQDRSSAVSRESENAEMRGHTHANTQDRRNAETHDSRNAEMREHTHANTQDRRNAETHDSGNAEMREHTHANTQDRRSAESQNSENAGVQERRNAEVSKEWKRVNRGYMLREDLIKSIKRLALEEDRKLYEVMEEALEEYLERRKAD
jgi:hypothetical protein